MINSAAEGSDSSFLTLSEKVYEQLKDEIISGKLRPGARLVRRSIGVRLGASAIPVSEALFRLEQDGLVESLPRYGSRVKLLTDEVVRNDRAFREAVECQAARLCAENATDAQLAVLRELAIPLDRLMAGADPQSAEGLDQHRDFHLAIARFCGYPIFERELKRLWFQRLMQLNWVNAWVYPVPDKWHESLVDVIAQRDPAAADAKMREHVRYGDEYYREALEKWRAQNEQSD